MIDTSDAEASFFKGCSLMQTQISVWLAWIGHSELAAKVMEMPPPKFQLAEHKD